MRQKIAIVLTGLLAVFLFNGFRLVARDGMSWDASRRAAMVSPDYEDRTGQQGRRVSDFELRDRFGNPIRLSQFASVDVLVVNVWSSGCPTCEREIPSLSELDRRLSSIGNAALITITPDSEWSEVAHYFPQGTDLRVLFDPEGQVVEGVLGTEKFPETFILDERRRVRARFDGERAWHTSEMLDYIETYL